MNPQNIAALVNLLGFLIGTALYAMLLAMGVRAAAQSGPRAWVLTEKLLLATGLLGLLWNVGALVIYGARDFGIGPPSIWFEASVFTALGFLPAVVVHSVLGAGAALSGRRGAGGIISAAYLLSSVAGLLQFDSARRFAETPSRPALQSLTVGFGALTVVLLLYSRRSPIWRRALWAVALAVFAVSALHLSRHTGAEDPWFIELIGHHSSLPLVIAMLYQDYRFAFADIFLKRALALVALVAIAFGLYLSVAAPLLDQRAANGGQDPRAVGALIGLWMGTALIYPGLRRAVTWFVDRVMLRRGDYHLLREEMARIASEREEIPGMLDEIGRRLAHAFTAGEVRWAKNEPALDQSDAVAAGEDRDLLLPGRIIRFSEGEADGEAMKRMGRLRRPAATILIPTHEAPRYSLVIAELSAGRQLLSDDLEFLESVAMMLARRIDALRVTHERCERNLREQEISKLATEAELRALRAQLNPHFLFNALTTIGYLIQTAPDRALETLMRLTGLLRAVLRAPSGDFVTIAEEIELIESYLAIERARFEDRLQITIDVPSEARSLRIPPLVIQPLVENAIKHGISPNKRGGEVIVSVIPPGPGAGEFRVSVRDTGAGVNDIAFAQGRRRGVGLANVERRLECFYGTAAALHFASQPGGGTTVELRVPIEAHAPLQEQRASA
ncbi:MAG: histidine kinase [Blastocatellia bacterium]|nr:histidine kinase [Blastocatellia bacterium]